MSDILEYNESVNGNIIEFDSVKVPQTLFEQGPIGLKNRITHNGENVTEINELLPFINSIDIDWNGVKVKNSSGNDININTTAELINWIQNLQSNNEGEGGNTPSETYTITYQISIYKWSLTEPTAPSDISTDEPQGWSKHIPDDPGNSSKLWVSYSEATYETNVNNTFQFISCDGWTDPVQIGESGSTAGEDKDVREYIYKLFNNEQSFYDDNNNPSYWNAVQDSDYTGPDGYEWNDNPQGVSENHLFEYYCYRDREGGTWGRFSQPLIWSHYGVNGNDGDGVEYVFARTSVEIPPIVAANSHNNDQSSNEFKPIVKLPENTPDNAILYGETNEITGNGEVICTDDNVGISREIPYEWVLTRKKTNGNWVSIETGTPMKLWAKYGVDGRDGEDGSTPNIEIIDGQLYIDGEPVGKIEGGSGSEGIKIKTLTGDKVEETSGTLSFKGCTNQNAQYESYTAGFYSYNNQIYYYSGTGCNLIKLGDSSGSGQFLHVAYAKWVTLNENNIASSALEFTITSTNKTKPWYGLCANDSESDPGVGLFDNATEINVDGGSSQAARDAIAQYKWNYIPGKDGNGVEFIYTLTKDGKPGINQGEGFRYNNGGYYLKSDKDDDEFLPLINDQNFPSNSSRPYFIIDGDPLPQPAPSNSDNYYIYVGEDQRTSPTITIDSDSKLRHWYDDPPQDVDSTWKYRWRAQRKKINGIWSNFGNVVEDDHWVAPNVQYYIQSNAPHTIFYKSEEASEYFVTKFHPEDWVFNFYKQEGGVSSNFGCFYKLFKGNDKLYPTSNEEGSLTETDELDLSNLTSFSNTICSDYTIITVVIGDDYNNLGLSNYLAKYEINVVEGSQGGNGKDSVGYYIETNPSSIHVLTRATGMNTLNVSYKVMKENTNSLPTQLHPNINTNNIYTDTVNQSSLTFYLYYRIINSNQDIQYNDNTEWQTPTSENLGLQGNYNNATGIQFILSTSPCNSNKIDEDYIFYSLIVNISSDGQNGQNGYAVNPNLIDGTDQELVLNVYKDTCNIQYNLNNGVISLQELNANININYNAGLSNIIDGDINNSDIYYYHRCLLSNVPNMSLKYKRIKDINQVSSSFKIKIELDNSDHNAIFDPKHFIRFAPYFELTKGRIEDNNKINVTYSPTNINNTLYIGFDCNANGTNLIDNQNQWINSTLQNIQLQPSSNINFNDDDEFNLNLALEIYGYFNSECNDPNSGNNSITINNQTKSGVYPMYGSENLKITIKDIKLEEGSESTPWCLSENDKKGKDGVTTTQIIQTEGELGKIIQPMGYWKDNKEYNSNSTITPLVYYNGKYYYLDPNCSSIIPESNPTDYYEPGNTEQPNNPWVEAEEYGVIITEGIFSDFAKFGSAVMSGNYMFSECGTYYNHNVVDPNSSDGERSLSYSSNIDSEGVHYNDLYTDKIVTEELYNYWSNHDANNELLLGTITRPKNKTLSGYIYTPKKQGIEKWIKITETNAINAEWDTAKNSSSSGYYVYNFIIEPEQNEQTDKVCTFKIKRPNSLDSEDEELVSYDIIYLEYNITPRFIPNWCTDLKTGKMIASGGNFICNPDGSIEAAKGNFRIDSDGNVYLPTDYSSTLLTSFDLSLSGNEATYVNYQINEYTSTVKLKYNLIVIPFISETTTYRLTLPPAEACIGETVECIYPKNSSVTNLNVAINDELFGYYNLNYNHIEIVYDDPGNPTGFVGNGIYDSNESPAFQGGFMYTDIHGNYSGDTGGYVIYGNGRSYTRIKLKSMKVPGIIQTVYCWAILDLW